MTTPIGRRRARWSSRWAATLLLVLVAGCAHFNTFYNAQKAFNNAEQVRKDRLKSGEDVTTPAGNQKTDYETAIKKAQKILDEYPGNSLTDDALFLQAKAHQRLNQYRQSINKLDLLFQNFPKTSYMEEALFLQAVNYLMVGEASRSQDMLARLEKAYPKSKFRAEALRTNGDSAYSLENWAEARDAYGDYLKKFPDVDGADEIGLRLGTSYWELKQYDEAVTALQKVAATTTNKERSFKARLLEARCLTKLDRVDDAQSLLDQLQGEAEIFNKRGDVLVAQAENLVARGKDDDAVGLLENMPPEWGTQDVRPRASDLLGYLYLRKGELDQSRTKFQEAVPGGKILDDPERSKRLLSTIQDYLAAENALPDAKPDRAARLRLLEANSLLFGFDRPRQALDLYTTVAADSAADSTDAARALYGAMLVYRTRLDDADSSRIYADELKSRYPQSPQAYDVANGGQANLLAFLESKLEAQQAERRHEAGADTSTTTSPVPTMGPAGPAVATAGRRREVFLQRRDNLFYPPPPPVSGVQPPLSQPLVAPEVPDEVTPADSTSTPGGLGR